MFSCVQFTMDTSDDHKLLQHNTYDDYLNALITKDDIRYLRSSIYGRQIAALGYRSATETLSRKQFAIRKQAVREALYPTRKLHSLVSDGCTSSDIFLQELAFRERSNRLCILSTIIFLRHHTKTGYEISGYIDFEESLRHSRLQQDGSVDWYAVFHENRRLWPKPDDLSYYHWRTGASYTHDTNNYKVITDPIKGLIFMSRHDRKRITVDPSLESPGNNTTRTPIFSDRYDHVVLYDHIVRTKI